jgi:hypothetical protein
MLLQETAWWLSLVFLIGDKLVVRHRKRACDDQLPNRRPTGSNPFHRSSGPLAANSSGVPSPRPISDPGRPNLLLMPDEHVLRHDLADGAVHKEVVVMVYGRILYVRTSIPNAKSRQPKIGLQVDGRTVDPNRMDPGLKSTRVGSMGGGIVALAVSNWVVFCRYPAFSGVPTWSLNCVPDSGLKGSL